MARPELIAENPINTVKLKQELEAIKKRDKELGMRAKKTEEYLNQFVSLSPKKAEELVKKLEGLKISRLKEEFIVKIVDTLPLTVDELKALLQSYVVSINQEDMKKVVKVVNDFATADK